MAVAPQAVLNRVWGVPLLIWPERTVELTSRPRPSRSAVIPGWMPSHLLPAPPCAPNAAVNGAFAGLVTRHRGLGAVGIPRATLPQRVRQANLVQVAAIVAWTGSLLTLITSAPETRFACPLVLFGKPAARSWSLTSGCRAARVAGYG